ncbi:MAG: hypothetical protein V1724_08305 [Chloroflexota bacterium]
MRPQKARGRGWLCYRAILMFRQMCTPSGKSLVSLLAMSMQ